MELLNHLYQFDLKQGADPARGFAFKEAVQAVVLLLAPMVPHMCEELWALLGGLGNIMQTPWPDFDPEVAREDEVEIVIQVNGKLRGKIITAADAPEENIKQQALACEQVAPWVSGKEIKKVIVVPGKLVSIVVK